MFLLKHYFVNGCDIIFWLYTVKNFAIRFYFRDTKVNGSDWKLRKWDEKDKL